MLKMVVESWKKEGMSREEFIDYLANVHGPLVERHGRALGFRKYVQNHRLPSPEIDAFAEGRGWAQAPDSSVEIWFDDMESMEAAFASPEGIAASAILEEDERRFVNPRNVSAFLAEEHIIFDFMAPGLYRSSNDKKVKMVCQAWKKSDMDEKAFYQYWQVQHGDLVREQARNMGFVRYVQSHRIPSPEIEGFAKARGWRQAPYGLTEIWFENEKGLSEAFSNPNAAKSSAILEEDEAHFVNPNRLTAFLAREHVVFDDIKSNK